MMGESRLISLPILSIECDLTSNVPFEEILRKFAETKSRKQFSQTLIWSEMYITIRTSIGIILYY